MPLFDWNRSDLHSLNLDWIISKIKTVEESEQGAVDAAANAKASKTAAAASATAANNSKTAAAGSATLAAVSAQQAQNLVDQLDTTIAQDVSDWLDEHITPTTPAVDDTLTVSGAAADAAVTGDKITELKTAINLNTQLLPVYNEVSGYNIYPQNEGFYTTSNGSVKIYELKPNETYFINNMPGTANFLCSNSPTIAQHKEYMGAGYTYTNTAGYKYMFVNGLTNGVDAGKTVESTSKTTVKVNNVFEPNISFDSDPQTQIDKIKELTDVVEEAIYETVAIATINVDRAIIADSSNQYYGISVSNQGTSNSDYVNISDYKKIKISVLQTANASTIVGFVFYDSNRNPIEGHTYAGGVAETIIATVAVPTGAVYVRTTYFNGDTPVCYGTNESIINSVLSNAFNGQKLYVAASDAPDEVKAAADFVCDGVNDEQEIQQALDLILPWTEGTVYLSTGTFKIDSFPHSFSGGKVAIKMASGSPTFKKIVGAGRHRNSKTVIEVTDTALTALGSDVGIVFGAVEFVYGRGARYEKFAVYCADNQHKLTVIDNSKFSYGFCNDMSISAVPSSISNTVNTPMPSTDCVGIVGFCGDDAGTQNEMNRVFVTGFYEGFRLGGEHLVCKNLGARFNYYAYTFGNYDWQIGTQSHPITLINCCDEHSACLPKFYRSGNYNEQSQAAKQEVNLIDFNMEMARSSNFGGGYVEPAEEVVNGAFCGRIEFTAYGGSNVAGYPNPSPATTNNPNIKFWKDGDGENFITRNMVHPQKGATAERNFIPTFMQQYFDTTLNKMLVYTGSSWVDMNGNAVD